MRLLVRELFHPFENRIYSQHDIVAFTKFLEVEPELLIVRACNLVPVAVFFDIAIFEAGKMLIESLVIILPVSFPQA